jgi:hypothetical protein
MNTNLDFISWGTGITVSIFSYLELFQSIALYTPSGKEIERIQDFDRFFRQHHTFLFGKNFLDNNAYFSTTVYNATDPAYVRDVLIPLPMLLGMFRCSTLLPSYALNNCELRITLKAAPTFTYFGFDIQNGAGAPENFGTDSPLPNITVSNVSCVMDHFEMQPVMMQAIRNSLQTDGLVIPFYTHTMCNTTNTDFAPSKQVTIDVPVYLAFSRCTKILFTNEWLPNNYLGPGPVDVYRNTVQNFREKINYIIYHNEKSYPNFQVDTISEGFFQTLLAYGKTRFYSTNESPVVETFLTRLGTMVVCNMSRGFNSYLTTPHDPLLAESNRPSSGVRVDGTAPIQLKLTVEMPEPEDLSQGSGGVLLPTDVEDGLTNADWVWQTKVWAEHERILRVRENNWDVFI